MIPESFLFPTNKSNAVFCRFTYCWQRTAANHRSCHEITADRYYLDMIWPFSTVRLSLLSWQLCHMTMNFLKFYSYVETCWRDSNRLLLLLRKWHWLAINLSTSLFRFDRFSVVIIFSFTDLRVLPSPGILLILPVWHSFSSFHFLSFSFLH